MKLKGLQWTRVEDSTIQCSGKMDGMQLPGSESLAISQGDGRELIFSLIVFSL